MRAAAFILGALLLAWGTMGFVSATQGLHEANIALEALIKAQQNPPSGGGFWGTLYNLFKDTQQKKQLQEQLTQLKVTIEQLTIARLGHRGDGARGIAGDDFKAGGHFGDFVAVAHPHFEASLRQFTFAVNAV